MEYMDNILNGFILVGTPEKLLFCFIGVLVGTVVGVLPGLGPVGAMAMLFPLSLQLDPLSGIILLAGIYYGSMYGGSTTSILLNVPGEATSMMTCIDGHQMAKKGRAGAALAVSAIGSWVAGTVGIVVVMFMAPWLGRAALSLGPPEFFAITLCGLVVLSNVTGGSVFKAFLGVILGMMLSTIGMDIITGTSRFTFGTLELSKGIDIVPIMMGLFGLSEIFSTVLNQYNVKDVVKVKFRDLYPRKDELKSAVKPVMRGTLVGLPIGLLPCPAAVLCTIISYKIERSLSKKPENFGKGAIEGVAGPESANNAASTTGMIPLLSLGLPFTASMTILLGAFMVHGVSPGPLFMTQHADLFWGVIASLYIGNVLLLILNYPLVGIFASLAAVPPKIIMPLITGVVFIGVYTVNNSVFDLWLALLFGLVGYMMKEHLDFKVAPLIIGFVLGGILEKSLRQGLVMVDGNILMMLQRPVTSVFLTIAAITLIFQLGRFFYTRMYSNRQGKVAV